MFKTAAKGPVPLEIPTLAEVSPEYAELTAKLSALTSEYGSLERELFELVQARRKELDEGSAHHSGFGREPTERDRRVAKLLDDPEPEAAGEPAYLIRRREINSRRSDILAAIAVLNKRITPERMKASRIICEQLEPRYRELVTEIADRMLDVVEAADRYRQFADELNRRDVAWSLMDPLSTEVGGAASSSGSRFRSWLRDAVGRGYGDRKRAAELLK